VFETCSEVIHGLEFCAFLLVVCSQETDFSLELQSTSLRQIHSAAQYADGLALEASHFVDSMGQPLLCID
jgi:hypothetical protein